MVGDDQDPAQPAEDESDAALLARSAADGGHAFGVLVRRHLRAATALAVELLGDLDDAEDVVQEAFVVALDRAAEFDAGRQFGPWLAGIVRNKSRRRLERAARRRRLLRFWHRDESTVQAEPGASERLTLADAVLASLPEMQRRCFTLHVVDGLPASDVAARFGITESTVRQHVFRARAALRRSRALEE
jgi:RNA polymerase sigma-70 factor (ECF subfamily)